MTDEQIEKLMMKEIRKRNVTFYDMVGMPDCGVDPHPEDTITPRCEKGIRSNRFKTLMGCNRMRELLCVGKYDEYSDSVKLKVSFQDLFRFWWNRCVVQEYVVDEVLEDIFDYLTERLRPPGEKEEEEEMDITLDFDQIPLFPSDLHQAA